MRQRTLRATDALSKAEAALIAKVTPRTISRWLADEGIPLRRYVTRVNRVAISKRELESFLAGRAS
jgi:hypothetical protein